MFTIDVYSNENYYVIKFDGRKFALVSKAVNSVLDVMKFFEMKE